MKISPLRSSLFALALFAVPAAAIAAQTAELRQIVIAQADQSTETFDAIRKFLKGGKNLSRLDADQLQQRMKRAERFQRVEGLPEDVAAGLQQEVAELKAELATRQSAGTDAPAEVENTQQSDTQTLVAEPEVPAQKKVAAEASSNGSNDAVVFLQSVRPAADLNDNELRQQMRQAVQLSKSQGISGEQRQQLRQLARDNRAEMQRRSSGGSTSDVTDTTAEETASPAVSEAETTQQNDNQTVIAEPEVPTQKKAAAEASSTGSNDAVVFLQSVRPAADLNDSELRQQMRQAVQLSKSQGISGEQRQQLRQLARDSRAEMQRRNSGSGTADASNTTPEVVQAPAVQKTQEQIQAQAETGAAASGDVMVFIQNAKPAAELNDAQLRQQTRQAADLAKSQTISNADRQQLRKIMRDGRVEMARRNDGGSQPEAATQNNAGTVDQNTQQVVPGTQQQTQLDNTKVDAGSEQKARALLDVQVNVRSMNRADLRKRLTAMRDLLASNQLSPATKKEMRQRLAEERVVLRSQVDQTGSAEQGNTTGTTQGGDVSGTNNNQSNTNVTVNNNTTNNINNQTVEILLRDRRPARDLRDVELRRRINVYRDVIVDNRYPEGERQELRVFIERDRLALRERMLNERRRRQQELSVGVQSGDIDFDLNLDFRNDQPPPPRSVFAAEADEEELEDILAAPPRRKIERRYTVEEVETSPELRDAVARIEIDTVRFGFGEGFLREEEIGNLDRIAEIIEKIVAANPNEVFMIEGHTDAVGSDPANLQLSRERAAAVKEALSTYYVIPAENLETVGFGERYLKIPTAEAEAENRRVSVARITPLVGALAD